ncbi:MAG TPA: lysozyme inhibitor LprI family protein [Chthoniobacterales bacterium]|nr:lysozyme inhibitor LprI family protein [Chthoniobacterales bacterium]
MLCHLRLFATAFPCLFFATSLAVAGEWPKDYVVQENSESPNGRYGVLVLSHDAAVENDSEESDVYLADVKAHTALGTIDKVDYFEHQNHRDLEVFWAPDSNYCVVESDGRYGMDRVVVLDIKDSKFVQTEIDEPIQKSLDGAMKKESHDSEMAGDVSVNFRLGDDRKIKVRATSQNNPKQFDDVKTYYALFQGTYDLAAKKWTVTDVRSITSEQDDALTAGYQPPDFKNITYATDEDRARSLDEQMNSVYKAAKFVLPPARFAKVKQEQTEWLKRRDATPAVKAQCELIEKRIRDLQDVLW